MATDSNGNGGVKAVGAIVLVLAVISGVYAMIEPMGQRIDFLANQFEDMRAEMAGSNGREREDAAALASINEKFIEVETQFRSLEHRIGRSEAWHDWWVKEIPALDACQDQRLVALERVLFQGKEAN